MFLAVNPLCSEWLVQGLELTADIFFSSVFVGKMFPTQGILYVAPFNDDALYMEQYNKALFW